MHIHRLVLILLVGASFGSALHAEDWRMFGRDQSRNAVSPEKNPPTFWEVEETYSPNSGKKNKNILWSVRLGEGSSYYGSLGDPVVVNGQIWIGSNALVNKEPHYSFVCLDEKTGKRLYRYTVPEMPFGSERFRHTMASSPLIEGDRIWFFNNRWEVVCMDLTPLRKAQGEPRTLWKVDTRTEFGVFRTKSIFDCRLCSVAIHKDWLYVITGNGVNAHTDKLNADAPSLVCFDKNTGRMVWKDNSPGKNIYHSQFASPTVITINGMTQVVAPQGDGWVRSFDAATGKLIWKFDTNPPDAVWERGRYWETTRNYLPATAVFHNNRIYIGNGQEPELTGGAAWLYCIDAAKTGDVSSHLADGAGKGKPNPNSGMIWKYGGTDAKTKRSNFGRTLSNVAIDRGLVIAFDARGTIHCLDEDTGKLYWNHDVRSTIESCPLIVDGNVYVGNDGGEVLIFKLAKEKKLVNRIEMDHWIRASPVYANGVLYIADGYQLHAIRDDSKKPAKR